MIRHQPQSSQPTKAMKVAVGIGLAVLALLVLVSSGRGGDGRGHPGDIKNNGAGPYAYALDGQSPGVSNPAHVAIPPRHVHVALAEAENSLRVSWFARATEVPQGSGAHGVVQFGFIAGSTAPLSLTDALPLMSHRALASGTAVEDFPCLDRGKPATSCVGGETMAGTVFVADLTGLFGEAAGHLTEGRVFYRVGTVAAASGSLGSPNNNKHIDIAGGANLEANEPGARHAARSGGGANGLPRRTVESEPLLWSQVYSVKFGGPSTPVTFTAVADMGTPLKQTNSRHVATALAADRSVVEDSEFLLHGGDLAYAFQDHSRWDQWFDMLQPVAANVPYMTAPGNRDDEPVFASHFFMPRDSGVKPAGARNLYYSFNKRFVHVTVINTEASITPDSEQYRWLVQDLEQASARRAAGLTAWTVVLGHTPLLSSSSGHVGGSALLREHVEPLFAKYGVDIAMFGDDHAYERSWPMLQGRPRLPSGSAPGSKWIAPTDSRSENDVFVDATGPGTQATIHLLIGTAGADLDPWVNPTRPEWCAKREIANGYMVAHVTPSRFNMKFISVMGASSAVADEFTLESKRHEHVNEQYGFTAGQPRFPWLLFVAIVAAAGYALWHQRQQQRNASRRIRLTDSSATVC